MDIRYLPMALLQPALACGRALMRLAVSFALSLLPASSLRHSAQLVPNSVSAATSICNIGSPCLRRKLRPKQERPLISDKEEELEWPSCLELSEGVCPRTRGQYQTNKPSS